MLRFLLATLFTFLTIIGTAQTIYVNHAATGNNDGNSWTNAYTDLQDALHNAVYGDEIWLAQGTYYPTQDTIRTIYFELPNGVGLYGGFSGTETTRDQRDWENNESILSGDIGEPDTVYIYSIGTDNSYTLLYTEYCDNNTIIDGLTITESGLPSIPFSEIQNFEDRNFNGGGIFINGSGEENGASPIIRNCLFLKNSARLGGGAIYGYANGQEIDTLGSVNPTIINCQFILNYAPSRGGAIFQKNTMSNQNVLIEDCLFLENEGGEGGAIYLFNQSGSGQFIIKNCTFERNRPEYIGGAIFQGDLSTSETVLTIDNCFFSENGGNWGAAFRYSGGLTSPGFQILNSTFTNHHYSFEYTSEQGIGVVLLLGGGNIRNRKIHNCEFINNSAHYGGVIANSLDTLEISNSLFANNYATEFGGAIQHRGNKNHLAITNSLFYNNSADRGGAIEVGNYFDSIPATVSINNCIFEQNTATTSGSIASLYRGDLTINNSILDISQGDTVAIDTFIDASFTENNNFYNTTALFNDPLNDDFRLQANSPAINVGNNTIIDSLAIRYDLAGNPRILDGVVDIGPYEFTCVPLDISVFQHVSCPGWENGIATVQAAESGFSYLWDNGDQSITASGLSGGLHEVTLTDGTDCTVSAQIEVEEPDSIAVVVSSIPATSPDAMDGSLLLENISGGTAPYTQQWSNNSSNPIQNDLSPGNYSLTVTDAWSCEQVFDVEVNFITSTVEIDQNELFIAPNPVAISSKLTISDNFEKIEIYDLNGKLVLSHPFAEGRTFFPPQQQGIYFMQIKMENGNVFQQKIVVVN